MTTVRIASVASLTTCPIVVKATNDTTQGIAVEDTPDIEANASNNEVGDEMVYILNTDTKKSDSTPCQVTAKFVIPSGFNLNAYMDIMHDDGTVYRILAADANGYSNFAYVKEGHYVVLMYGIVNDAASRYSFTLSQESFDVSQTDSSPTVMTATIDDYDSIAQTIAERTGEEKQELDTVVDKEPDVILDRYPTNYEGVTIGSDGVLYYETMSNSATCTAQSKWICLKDVRSPSSTKCRRGTFCSLSIPYCNLDKDILQKNENMLFLVSR